MYNCPTFFLFWKCLDDMSYWTNCTVQSPKMNFHFFTVLNLNYTVFVSLAHMYVSTHSHLPCSHFYIFICVSLRVSLPCQSRFSKVLNYVCHTCLLFLLSCHLNLLYSHHPSWYSHLRSFYQVLISISQFPCLTSIHQIRSDDGLVYCHFKL